METKKITQDADGFCLEVCKEMGYRVGSVLCCQYCAYCKWYSDTELWCNYPVPCGGIAKERD